MGRLLRWALELLLALLLAAVLVLIVYQPVKVEGASMLPGLVDNERLFINRFVYRLGLAPVQRGDTVVFQFPPDPSRTFIKRVIGLPGDTVEIIHGAVYVNGVALPEPYVPEEYRDTASLPALRVAADHYFVLGDHRCASNDSRAFGPIPRSAIYGRAVFAYWPLEHLGRLP